MEYDDITIDIPKGTFKGSSKVNISEVEKGLIGGENELSKFYKVKFYAGVAKNFNVSFKMPQVTNGDAVKMQFSVMGWAPSLNEECMVDNMFETSYAGGAYVAEIPAMESPEDADEIEVYFGVRKYNLLSNNSPARTRVPGSRILPALEWPEDCLTSNYQQVDYYLSNWGLDKLGEAGSILENLGYEPVGEEPGPYVIRYCVKKGGGEHPGYYSLNPWGKRFSTITLCTDAIGRLGTSGNYNSLMETVIHETFHWFQMYYDPRSALRLFLGFNHFRGRTLLNEAASVWSETYYTAKGMPSNVTKENVMFFLSCANDITFVEAEGLLDGVNFDQNKGYGASALLAYLSKKLGIGIVYDIFKKRLTSSDLDPDDSIGIIEKVADENKLDIFSQKGYKEFVEALGTNKVYEGYNFTDMLGGLYKMKEYWTLDGFSMVKGGVIKKTLSGDDPKVNFYNYVYDYGALVESLDITARTIDEKFNGIENTTTIIEQMHEGLTTYVYGYENGNYYYIGSTKEGAPLELPNKIYFKQGSFLFSNGCVLVTILDEFKVKHAITYESKIEARVEGKEVEFEVEPDHLDFEAGGGTQRLTVTTNQPKFQSELDEDSKRKGWLKISEVEGGVDVTATPNTDPTPRKGYVIVTPISAAGKVLEDKVVTIPVTQNPSFLVNVEPNPITLPGYGSEFKNGKMTSSFTVKYIKDAKSVNVRVEFEQDDKDKSWLTLDGDWATQTSDDMLFICKRNFTFTPNTSFTKSRSAKIIVELTMPDGSKPDPEIVPVTQEPMQAELKLEPGKVDLQAEDSPGAATSDVVSVNIESNLFEDGANVFKDEEFTTSGDEGGKWIFAERNGKKIDIWATAYQEETGFRKGTLTYTVITTTGESVPASVEVSQHGRAEGLPFYIDPSYIHFPYKGGALDVTVLGEKVEKIVDYDFVWNDNSAGFGASSSPSSMTIHMLCEQNPFKEARSFIFSITVELKGGTQYTRFFTVHQDGEVSDDPDNPDDPDQGGTEKHNYNGKFIGSWAWGKPGDAVYEKYTFASDGTLYRNGVVYGTFTVIADDHDSDPSGGFILEKKVLSVTRNGKQSTWNITVAYELDSVDMQGNYIYAEVLYIGWNPYNKVEDEE